MVDIYHSSNFDELEAARNGEPDESGIVTKDVTPEQVEQAPAEVVAPSEPPAEIPVEG